MTVDNSNLKSGIRLSVYYIKIGVLIFKTGLEGRARHVG